MNFLALPSALSGDFKITGKLTCTSITKGGTGAGIGLGYTTGFSGSELYGYAMFQNNNGSKDSTTAGSLKAVYTAGTDYKTVTYDATNAITNVATGTEVTFTVERTGTGSDSQKITFSWATSDSSGSVSLDASDGNGGTGAVYPCIAWYCNSATITNLVVTDSSSGSAVTVFNSAAQVNSTDPTVVSFKDATLSINAKTATLQTNGTADIVVTSTQASTDGAACAFTAVSSNESIAKVSSGTGTGGDTITITAVGQGLCTVTFTNSTKTSLTASVSVTVADCPSSNAVISYTTSSVAYPASGASGAYTNGELRLTFDDEPTVSSSGMAMIYKYDGTTATVADIIKFNDETQTVWSGKTINVGNQLVRKDGKNVYITPHYGVLAASTKYFVALTTGAITGKISGVDFTGLTNTYDETNGWYFTTGTAYTPVEGTVITVDRSEVLSTDTGAANFRSIQAALLAIGQNAKSWEIDVAAGTYYEPLNYLGNGGTIKIVGAVVTADSYGSDVVVSFKNNNLLNSTSSHTRALAYFAYTNLVLEHITLNNTSRYGDNISSDVSSFTSAQAEALFFANSNINENGGCYHVAAWDCSFISRQDTICSDGMGWFYKCYVEGDTDYIWGSAKAFLFEKCKLTCDNNEYSASQSKAGTPYIIQAR